ncbi:30S ribosomal protein S5 [Candidatus Woesearchaeota archaeon]|nr:30S ribosomal protein S5 [Candidatus Woesearchaeota archaeon]
MPKEPEDLLKEIPIKKELEGWNPKTEIGKQILRGEIKDIEQIIDKGRIILEPEIVDALIPELESELLLLGQSKGKFGGGQRRVFKQTQKKTQEGNKPKFSTMAVVGNRNGIVGLGSGKAKETVPAREKAFRNAKLNMIKIRRGCGSWQCNCKTSHSIPFAVKAKVGSVVVELMPAPKGKGLCIQNECRKMLDMAGIKDVWSKTKGKTASRANLIIACYEALKTLADVKIHEDHKERFGIEEGAVKNE